MDIESEFRRNLTVLPHLDANELDKFIEKERVVKETSIRGYRFFLEGYVHDVEGWFYLFLYDGLQQVGNILSVKLYISYQYLLEDIV